MPAETILFHLAVANQTMFLTRGVPHSLYGYGFRNLFDLNGCRLIGTIHRASRAMAISLMCLLSCFQCAVISTANLLLKYLKVKLHKHLALIIFSLYLINSASSVTTGIFSAPGGNTSLLKYGFNFGYCLVVYPDQITYQVIGFGTVTRDLIFVILMILASTYILLILYKHGKRVKGIRNSDQSSAKTAEGQATKTILSLVILYTLFFGADNVLWFYQIASTEQSVNFITDLRHLLSMCYPAVFPFFVIAFNPKENDQSDYQIHSAMKEDSEVSCDIVVTFRHTKPLTWSDARPTKLCK
ncbi:olfactory receptor class A-like protein 1 [Protopterus annectens]|uniref:olfactory receptor class A-like protein 1 n=1 Tax=Protopterus annectens TaxID=7888 RepID=UPI001CFC04AB|nr:olfactory receptor class A-like protein 1 [Protopterus annectens]